MRSLGIVGLALLGTTSAFGAAPAEHFGLAVSFVAPAKPGAEGAVAVTFSPKDADVRVNQEPAPRLKLDPAQTVLVDKQPPPPTRLTPFDPATAKYIDPKEPVRFPVVLAPGAAKGVHDVKASVTYFYCSKREGWCRKGSAEVGVPVTVP
jgi:hypothetical protein